MKLILYSFYAHAKIKIIRIKNKMFSVVNWLPLFSTGKKYIKIIPQIVHHRNYSLVIVNWKIMKNGIYGFIDK